jgi:quinol-cytochrome oxidoreductase complex cytochrome b subunit
MTEFNPYSAPETEIALGPHAGDDDGVWSYGPILVMTKTAELPDFCLKCNQPTGGWKIKRKLTWHNPYWYLLILFNLLIYAIVAVIVRQTAKVNIPLCERHRRRRRWAIAWGWLLALAGIGAIVWGASRPETELSGLLVMIGIVAILVGLVGGIVGSQVASVDKIDKRYVWLKKVPVGLLAKLPPWQPEPLVDKVLES